MNPELIKEAAHAISGLIDALEERGVGPELTQKITIECAPVILSGVVYTTGGY